MHSLHCENSSLSLIEAGNEICHTTDVPLCKSETLFANVNSIQSITPEAKGLTIEKSTNLIFQFILHLILKSRNGKECVCLWIHIYYSQPQKHVKCLYIDRNAIFRITPVVWTVENYYSVLIIQNTSTLFFF